MLMNDPNTRQDETLGIVQVAILILTLIILCAMMADTVFVLPRQVSRMIAVVDTFVCAIFLADFFVRLRRAENKRAFLKWGWIDLVASIPNLQVLRWGRLVRVLRIIRLLRAVRSVQRILHLVFLNKREAGAVSLALTAFLLIIFSSVSILICEQRGDANIKTAEDAVWWSVSTMTTVGYGDKYPVTTEGRIIGMILMFAGVGMFGGLSGLVASFFIGADDRKSVDPKEILTRLDRLQATVDTLKPERAEGPPQDKSG